MAVNSLPDGSQAHAQLGRFHGVAASECQPFAPSAYCGIWWLHVAWLQWVASFLYSLLTLPQHTAQDCSVQ